MADTKISDLTETTALAGTEELVVADGGTSKKVTAANVLGYTNVTHPPRVTGRYYGSPKQGQVGTRALTADRIYHVLIPVPEAITITRIGVDVTTAAASTIIRLGIYTVGTDGLPDALVLDAGTVDSSSTGFKEITVSQALQGQYYFCAVSDGTPTVRAQNVSYIQGDDDLGFSSPSTRCLTGIYESSLGSGALPSTSASSTVDANSNPRLWYRVV